MIELHYNTITTERNDIEQLYFDSFPKEERYPFWAIVERAQSDSIKFLAIYDEDTLVGFTYLIYYLDIVYIFYLAVAPKLRNQGYGSQILRNIAAQNHDKKLLLCIEYPDNKIKQRRRNFYLRNDMHSTNTILENFGAKYEFLCSEAGYQPGAETIGGIYKTLADTSRAGQEIQKNLETNNIKLESAS